MTDQRAAYFQRATSWAVDEQQSLRGSVRRTRIAAGVFAVIAILEALALLLLTPLKTSVPIPVLVDRQTGYVETLKADGRRELQADTALTQSLLAQYVMARESFDIADVSAEYRKVALWSGGAALHEYLALMPASNPSSPLRRYPRTAVVETRVKSVSPLGPGTALVRFETHRRDQDPQASQPTSWAAVVEYRFSNAPLSVAERLVNPLGFQVVRYRRDAETAAPAEAPATLTPVPTLATAPTEAVPLALPVYAVPPASAPVQSRLAAAPVLSQVLPSGVPGPKL